MKIRMAQSTDAAVIAPLLLLAMEDVFFNFIGSNSKGKATSFLTELISLPNNQYSHENCWVLENEKKIIAVACVYDGAKLVTLRQTVANLIRTQFLKEFSPEDETQAGEIYIDCIGVDPKMQGQGIGSQLLAFLIDFYSIQSQKKLGLLVDKENPKAKKLYYQLGFEMVDERMLTGKSFEHLQFIPR